MIEVRRQLSWASAGSPPRRVAPKTKASVRDIPLAPQLETLPLKHRLSSAFPGDADCVFASAVGRPLGHRNTESRGLAGAAERARLNRPGEPRLRFHDLRHTFASHLIIDLGLDVVQVSRALGHARTSITLDVYAHLFEASAHGRDIRQRLGRSEFGNLLAALDPTLPASEQRRPGRRPRSCRRRSGRAGGPAGLLLD